MRYSVCRPSALQYSCRRCCNSFENFEADICKTDCINKHEALLPLILNNGRTYWLGSTIRHTLEIQMDAVKFPLFFSLVAVRITYITCCTTRTEYDFILVWNIFI